MVNTKTALKISVIGSIVIYAVYFALDSMFNLSTMINIIASSLLVSFVGMKWRDWI